MLNITLLLLTFSNYQLNAQFLLFFNNMHVTLDPQHVSSSTLLILRRINCITTICPSEVEQRAAGNMLKIVV